MIEVELPDDIAYFYFINLFAHDPLHDFYPTSSTQERITQTRNVVGERVPYLKGGSRESEIISFFQNQLPKFVKNLNPIRDINSPENKLWVADIRRREDVAGFKGTQQVFILMDIPKILSAIDGTLQKEYIFFNNMKIEPYQIRIDSPKSFRFNDPTDENIQYQVETKNGSPVLKVLIYGVLATVKGLTSVNPDMVHTGINVLIQKLQRLDIVVDDKQLNAYYHVLSLSENIDIFVEYIKYTTMTDEERNNMIFSAYIQYYVNADISKFGEMTDEKIKIILKFREDISNNLNEIIELSREDNTIDKWRDGMININNNIFGSMRKMITYIDVSEEKMFDVFWEVNEPNLREEDIKDIIKKIQEYNNIISERSDIGILIGNALLFLIGLLNKTDDMDVEDSESVEDTVEDTDEEVEPAGGMDVEEEGVPAGGMDMEDEEEGVPVEYEDDSDDDMDDEMTLHQKGGGYKLLLNGKNIISKYDNSPDNILSIIKAYLKNQTFKHKKNVIANLQPYKSKNKLEVGFLRLYKLFLNIDTCRSKTKPCDFTNIRERSFGGWPEFNKDALQELKSEHLNKRTQNLPIMNSLKNTVDTFLQTGNVSDLLNIPNILNINISTIISSKDENKYVENLRDFENKFGFLLRIVLSIVLLIRSKDSLRRPKLLRRFFIYFNSKLDQYILLCKRKEQLITSKTVFDAATKLCFGYTLGSVVSTMRTVLHEFKPPRLKKYMQVQERIITALSDETNISQASGGSNIDAVQFNSFLESLYSGDFGNYNANILERYLKTTLEGRPLDKSLMRDISTYGSFPIVQKFKNWADESSKYYINNAVTYKNIVGENDNRSLFFCPVSSIIDGQPTCSSKTYIKNGYEYSNMDVRIHSTNGKMNYRIRIDMRSPKDVYISAYLQIGDNVLINKGLIRGTPCTEDWPRDFNEESIYISLDDRSQSPLTAVNTLQRLMKYFDSPKTSTSSKDAQLLWSDYISKLRSSGESNNKLRRELISLSFQKSLGDFLQEINGVVENSGYIGERRVVMPEGTQIVEPSEGRLTLMNDRPSAIRSMIMTMFGKSGINKNAVVGFINNSGKYVIVSRNVPQKDEIPSKEIRQRNALLKTRKRGRQKINETPQKINGTRKRRR
jgi:hypothetical protein